MKRPSRSSSFLKLSHVCMYVCMHACMHACMSAYMCPYAYACKCPYVCVYIMYHVRMQARMHVHTVMVMGVMVITARPLHTFLYAILVA